MTNAGAPAREPSTGLTPVGLSWTQRQPRLLALDNSGRQAEVTLALGTVLRGQVLTAPRCLGPRGAASSAAGLCPDPQGQIVRGRCARCRARDPHLACIACDGYRCDTLRLSNDTLSYCNQPRALYLARFGGDWTKVGTALDHRVTERLDEQGPIAAMVVARGPGRAVKQAETDLAAAVRDRVRGATRTTLLRSQRDGEAEYGDLVEFWSRWTRSTAAHLHLAGEPQRWLPTLSHRRARRLQPTERLALTAGTQLAGVIRGVSGTAAVIEDSAGVFTVELTETFGATLLLDVTPPPRHDPSGDAVAVPPALRDNVQQTWLFAD